MSRAQIEYLAISALRPWPKNARIHSKRQIKQIADSIRRFGFTNPVLIDRENTMLAGHGRVAAAQVLGLAEVPCIRIETRRSLRPPARDELIVIRLPSAVVAERPAA
jgi:ParB-like chromosome segregation protein Spo0J